MRTDEEAAARKQKYLDRTKEQRKKESERAKSHPQVKSPPIRHKWVGHDLVTEQKIGGKWIEVSCV
jgi:hypothetical protein